MSLKEIPNGGNSSGIVDSMILSGLFEFGKILLTALFYALLARHLSAADFGSYVLIRKVAVWFLPFTSFGTYVGLSYFLPYSNSQESRGRIIVASFTLISLALLLSVPFLIFFRAFFIKIFFGGMKIQWLLILLLLIIISETICQYVISVNRGLFKIFNVNLYRLLLVALIPLTVILAMGRSFDLNMVVIAIAVASLLLFIIPLSKIILQWKTYFTFENIVIGTKVIWKYCVLRIPTNLIFTGMLSVWLVITAHYFDKYSLAYISVGIALFGALGTFIVPFEIVLLPAMRKLSSSGTQMATASLASNAIQCSFDIAVYITFQTLVLAPFIVRWWLGGGDLGSAVIYIRIMSPMLFGYTMFTALYGLIDEISARAINTYIAAVSIGSALMFFVFGRALLNATSLNWLCISCVLQFTILGLLAMFVLKKHFQINFDYKTLLLSFGYSLLAGVIMTFISLARINQYASFTIVMLSGVIVFAIYIRMLAFHGAVWSCRVLGKFNNLIVKGFAFVGRTI